MENQVGVEIVDVGYSPNWRSLNSRLDIANLVVIVQRQISQGNTH